MTPVAVARGVMLVFGEALVLGLMSAPEPSLSGGSGKYERRGGAVRARDWNAALQQLNNAADPC
jgi:hypothetical protein